MPNFIPAPAPLTDKDLGAYVYRELHRVGQALLDSADRVLYRTLPATDDSLTAGTSANYKTPSGNVVRISTSNTVTITGIAHKNPNREVVYLNSGTGVLAFKSEGTESSASFRLLMATNWQVSANASITFWYDGKSSRHRAIAKT